MPARRKPRDITPVKLFEMIVGLPGIVWWLLIIWEHDISAPFDWNILFYSGIGVAALLSIFCGIFIAVGGSHAQPTLLAWYITVQGPALVMVAAKLSGLGGEPDGSFEVFWYWVVFGLSPFALSLGHYFRVRKLLSKIQS